MNKYFKNYAVRWAIFVALFNIIVFVTPDEWQGMYKYGGGFWAGYLCTMLGFVLHLAGTWYALKADSAEKMFLNMPLLRISNTGLFLLLIVGIATMFVFGTQNWMGIVGAAIVLGFTGAAYMKAVTAAEAVTETGDKIKEKTAFMKGLSAEVNRMASECGDGPIAAEIRKLAEAVKYSDPVSSSGLAEAESLITKRIAELKETIGKDDADGVLEKIKAVTAALEDRNRQAKELK